MTDPLSYSVFGLIVRSEVALIELPASREGAGEADIEVRIGPVDLGEADQPGYAPSPAGTLLIIPKVANYLIRAGREIVIDPDPAASESNIRLYLLGSAFGALLHQRGLMPLHANAIELDGRAVAFSGHSGAGKSTIAAWFHDRGHRILADDVCVISFDPAGRPIAWPGIPRLRLWREALEASGRSTDSYRRSFDDLDKYDVPTRRTESPRPLPLDRIYLLRRAEEGAPARPIRRLTGVEAVDAIVANTYRGSYLRTIGGTGAHLAASVRLARAAPVFAAERVWGFSSFDEQASALDRHARAGLAAAS